MEPGAHTVDGARFTHVLGERVRACGVMAQRADDMTAGARGLQCGASHTASIEKGMHGVCGIGFGVRLARRDASSTKRACLQGSHDSGIRAARRWACARRKSERGDRPEEASALLGKVWLAVRPRIGGEVR
ncbi:hypothetical protein PT2222_10203 [Paraburkholderia tropica]